MTARHLRTEPVTGDDALVERALAGTSVLALVAAVVHLTGDPSILRGPIRPRRIVFNEFDGGLTEAEQASLRSAALTAVLAYRDGGSVPSSTPPDDAVVRELMEWLAVEPVPDDYAALFLEELDLAGADPRRIEVPTPDALSVLVIGCGMSGLLAGVRLQQAGIPFAIVEKNPDVGGTWYENTYPGCRVDVGNHYYCYSFEPNHAFGGYFARQPELHAYFRDVMERHDIAPHVRWSTEVERAVWDDDDQRWKVGVRDGEGRREELTVNVVISAVGQLNRPFVPDIPGLDRFAGPVFHSAQWDHRVDLTGRRVALVGAGASGFQIGPAIVDRVERLVVFQRTAQWMIPNRLYHEAVDPGAQWAMRHLPGYARWYRFLLLWQATDKMLDLARVDPDWPGLPQSANARSARFRESILDWIDEHVGHDPELVAKLVPDYPPLGKRLLQDNGSWLRCLDRDHVDLVRDPIVEVDEHGIVTEDDRFDVDAIVLATGFRANDFLAPMEIVGRDGRSLREVWDGRPAAYLGVTVPGYPNFFVMYGPGTNLAHAGSVIFQSECQLRYIGGCLGILSGNGGGAIEPTTAAFDDYVERWQAEQATMVWSHPSVRHSWYKAPDGHVYVLSPWRLVDYWRMTAGADPAMHAIVTPKGAPSG
ncbi:MAG: flavin-containing monooxygenase [Acidimicrobiia bacterium]